MYPKSIIHHQLSTEPTHEPAAVMANIRIINGIYSNQSLCVQTVYTEYKVSVLG